MILVITNKETLKQYFMDRPGQKLGYSTMHTQNLLSENQTNELLKELLAEGFLKVVDKNLYEVK